MTNHNITSSVVNMAVSVGSMQMKNPMLTASGTFGYGEEFADFIDLERLGGFIVKGTTLEPREGNPYPRMVETPSGMLNAVGLQNKGLEHFVSDIYPRLKNLDTNVLVNVSGAKIDDYVAVAEHLAPLERIPAIEVNISCPNVKQGGMAFGTTCEGAAQVTAAIRKAWPRTLIVKLSPNVTSIADIAKAVESEGADAVSLINTLMGMAVDVERRKPCLSTVTGGLSGAAVRPVAVRMVWQTAKAVNIPVVGLGGISCGRDAIEFMLAGARAVQIGTANFIDPQITVKAIDWMEQWCIRHGVTDINDIVGEI